MKTKLFAMLVMLIAVLFIGSCRKDRAGLTGPIELRMMDAPSPYGYDKVYIDLKGVEVNVMNSETGESPWISLNVNTGIYNILDLVNGKDVLLANEEIATGQLQQVRFILGTNNSVVINGITYPLDVPSGNTSGLKLNVHEFIVENDPLLLYVDFDAAQSIVAQGNGTFSLKPVLRAFLASETGIVMGGVLPPGSGIAVTLSDSKSLYTTYADSKTGEFSFHGIPEGTYALKVYLKDSDIPIVKDNIQVSAGATTDVGIIQIRR
jgi:hypothetical protein